MKPPSGQKNKPNSNPIKACPVLAEALSAVEWANFFKGQNELNITCQKIRQICYPKNIRNISNISYIYLTY